MNIVSNTNLRMSAVKMAYNLSLVTKILCPSLILSLLLSFLFDPRKPLAVTPGLLIPPNFWIWTILTHSFIETEILLVIFGIISLTICENMLEQWNSVKLAIYYGIIAVASSVIGALFYLMLYMATFNIDYLYRIHIYGTGSLVGGALIAVVQTYGDHTPVQIIGVPLRLVPLLAVFVMIALRIFGLLRGSYLLLFSLGLLVSWVYLRFYQNHSRGRGDQSKKFAFKCFFPKPCQGPVGIISDIVYNFLLTTKICKKTVYRYDVGAPNNINLTITGVQSLDAERRRNKAIKALDERLKKSSLNSLASDWPNLNEEKESEEEVSPAVPEPPKAASQGTNSSGDGSASPDIVTIDMDSPSNAN